MVGDRVAMDNMGDITAVVTQISIQNRRIAY